MTTTTVHDPLGAGIDIAVELPLGPHDHIAPDDALTALHRAGLTTVHGVYIDHPLLDAGRWPAADAAFRDAIARAHPRATITPLVWVRVRTAPRYPATSAVESEGLIDYDRYRTPRDPTWPPDFTGVPAGTLRTHCEAAPGAELIQHVPPGDGWHRIAWVRFDYPNATAVDLLCECSIQQLNHPDGHTTRFGGNEHCAYQNAAAYLRALSRQHEFPHPVPAALRDMLDLALAGDWLGQLTGNTMWGSNLYLQAVSVLLDTKIPWELVDKAVGEGLISIDGAVLGLPRPVREVPAGPVMPWDSDQPTDGDWVIWWSRLDGRYQVEVIHHPERTNMGLLKIYDHDARDAQIHSQRVSVAYGAVFGPDVSDVGEWKHAAATVIDAHET